MDIRSVWEDNTGMDMSVWEGDTGIDIKSVWEGDTGLDNIKTVWKSVDWNDLVLGTDK